MIWLSIGTILGFITFVNNWTTEAEESKRVAITGIDDKKQITAVLSVTMSGFFLHHKSNKAEQLSVCLSGSHTDNSSGIADTNTSTA